MLKYLQLLHLADSALPIGTLAHSSGLEWMAAHGYVSPKNLLAYLEDSLEEGLLVDAVFCRAAHTRCADLSYLQTLNQHLNARRPARETRSASLTLGRRFLNLVASLEDSEGALAAALELADVHFAIAFGMAAGILGFNVEETVMAFLHQGVLNILSAAQRLMPLGQREASRMAWCLKSKILKTGQASATQSIAGVFCFSHLPDLASMRHPTLATRLFIS